MRESPEGLLYVPEFLSPEEQAALLHALHLRLRKQTRIYCAGFSSQATRRPQHLGKP